jgi:SAM-dependent methyltransferase/uncharacterized protein YbaR (Trm112 family)
MMNENNHQSIDNMKSEILFREKLATQHVEGDHLVEGYINKEDHDILMQERVATTAETMKRLKEQEGVTLSPFIEVGAERGQRSLVLSNDFGAEGFAIDLSFAQLKTLDYWMKFFNKPNGPIRICCDIHQLPFQANSLNFAFCYQFLHHFPSPAPIIKEINRVMASGHFFFDEEPYKRYSLKLYRRKVSNTPGTIKKYLRYLESFIADQYETEEEYGIIENDDIPLNDWLQAVDLFDEKRIFLQSASLFHSEIGKASSFKIRLHKMLGGGVSALVKKVTSESPTSQAPLGTSGLYNLLGCPICKINYLENGKDRAPLVFHEDYFKCDHCKAEYPVIEKVIFLLPQEKMKELYPKLAR